MQQLKRGGRSNVPYALAHGLGTTRSGSSETRSTTDRMPMGLLEYMANFLLPLMSLRYYLFVYMLSDMFLAILQLHKIFYNFTPAVLFHK